MSMTGTQTALALLAAIIAGGVFTILAILASMLPADARRRLGETLTILMGLAFGTFMGLAIGHAIGSW